MIPETELPSHLDRIGRQLVAAAHHFNQTPEPRRRWRGRSLLAAPVVATAVAAAVLITTAGPSVPPAYALTQNADGSYTLSLNDLTTGIPQLNARLKAMNIQETVVPVTPGCTTQGLVGGPGSMSETITLSAGGANLPAGDVGYLAAEQLPDGSIAIGIGARPAPLPSCFSPQVMTVQLQGRPSGTSTDADTPGRRPTAAGQTAIQTARASGSGKSRPPAAVRVRAHAQAAARAAAHAKGLG